MKRLLVLFAVLAFLRFPARADEGMWLFDQPPSSILSERYGFEPGEEWLRHLRMSSVRLNSGGSGSFVSEDGLLVSNHHVAASHLQKLSTAEKNYLRDGFHARTLEEELKCLDLELNVLQSIEDVTERVNAAVSAGADSQAAFEARRKVIAEVENESQKETGLRSDVVTLWQGGAYHLYRYKRYTDVRMVFAPEQQIAFLGGDVDNFEFPRYDLDVCFFRAYEDGQPARTKDYLKFSPQGPKEGDLVFVSGHPGNTSRGLTMAELSFERDVVLPRRLQALKRLEVLLASWAQRSPENSRRAHDLLLGVQNGRKALDGRLAGLLDPQLFSAKADAERDFRKRLNDDPVHRSAAEAYDQIAESLRITGSAHLRYSLMESRRAFTETFRLARALLRAGDEFPKPNGERLREFSDSSKPSLELALFSEKPIYADLEVLLLTDFLTFFSTELGVTNDLVQAVLGGKSPKARASELIQKTQMRDAGFRKKLYEGGAEAVAAAQDPMIELARIVDGEARALRQIEEQQDEVRQQAHAAIARARNALVGTTSYPDATFTLRLSFGTVKGYVDEAGQAISPFTQYAGLYQRAREMNYRPPFDLPEIWLKRKGRLDLNTHLNFVSTCDIIGGNSGSPVVNRRGEFVGIIFDGNLESLPWDYHFNDEQGRATSVDSAAIAEALRRVYDARELTRELRNGSRAAK